MRPQLSQNILKEAKTSQGGNLAELSNAQPTLLIFLRQLGCIFCRETLAELSVKREAIEKLGIQIVLVHLGDLVRGTQVFSEFDLESLPQVSDTDKKLYQYFELKRGNVKGLLSLNLWLRGVHAVVNGMGLPQNEQDPMQLSGAILIYQGEIHHAFRHENFCDRMPFAQICEIGETDLKVRTQEKPTVISER